MVRRKSGCLSAMIQLSIVGCLSLALTAGVVAWMAASEGTTLTEVVPGLLRRQPTARLVVAHPTVPATDTPWPSPTPTAVAPTPVVPTPTLLGETATAPRPTDVLPTQEPLPIASDAPPASPPAVQVEPAIESPVRAGSSLPEHQATRLVIPPLDLDVPVILSPIVSQTWQVKQLGKDFVGHLEGTASPGDPSNVVLAGHVTLASNVYGPFAGLGKLQLGDPVVVYVGDQSYTYVIDNRQLVDRTEVQVTYPTRTARITLITCTDWSDELKAYQKRLVVTGHLAQ